MSCVERLVTSNIEQMFKQHQREIGLTEKNVATLHFNYDNGE